MRIDFVITGLELGGAETQVVALLEKLSTRGHQLQLISLKKPSSSILIKRLSTANVPLVSLNMNSWRNTPLAMLRLRKIWRKSPPQIVHSHMIHANVFTRLMRLLIPSLNIIGTAHNTYEGGKFCDLAYRLTNPLSQINTTISEAATLRFTRDNVFSKKNTLTISNGVDMNKFHPPHLIEPYTKPFHWLVVGRLVEQKDFPTLIAAFNQLSESLLFIAGEGPLLDTLQRQVKSLGLEERIIFLGAREDIEALYHQVDGFVLSSQFEGYGLVIAEAMASELPVVVTDSGGPREIVGSDGLTGLLVPIKDTDALSQGMLAIEALSPEERKNIGRRARQRINDTFSLDKIVAIWEALYEDRLSQRQ